MAVAETAAGEAGAEGVGPVETGPARAIAAKTAAMVFMEGILAVRSGPGKPPGKGPGKAHFGRPFSPFFSTIPNNDLTFPPSYPQNDPSAVWGFLEGIIVRS